MTLRSFAELEVASRRRGSTCAASLRPGIEHRSVPVSPRWCCNEIKSMARAAASWSLATFHPPEWFELRGHRSGLVAAKRRGPHKLEESSDLILGIERAARGFESFSLPEDGQAGHGGARKGARRGGHAADYNCNQNEVVFTPEAKLLC